MGFAPTKAVFYNEDEGDSAMLRLVFDQVALISNFFIAFHRSDLFR